LPFYPSSADRGFAPMTYERVDEAYGSWDEVKDLSKDFYLMYDYMINHISKSSIYFKDFLENKDSSEYKDFFIRYKEFWNEGEPPKEQLDKIYTRKPRAPYIEVEFSDGIKEKIWCTFDEEQIDLDVSKSATKRFISETLKGLCERGASIIRLDAFAYAIKKIHTSCFFVEPDTWELLDFVKQVVEPYNVLILPEIHEHYSIQLKISEKDFWVYDFALPMLLLHTLYSADNRRLISWLKICPRNQFTTLDTHDGIGVVDVKDLMSDEEIEKTKESLYSKGANIKRIYSTASYNNLDIYQINCTYYSALGNNDEAYLLARAIQFFSPGIPQVYYVGLLAGENDIKLLEKTKVGRNINRHNYTIDEIENNIERPVLKKLYKLMKFRNFYKAFNGDIELYDSGSFNTMKIGWKKGKYQCTLEADLEDYKFSIKYYDNDTYQYLSLF
jgi:sucrose phosphorylase